MSSPRSLILITVDCLCADHVGFLGYKGCTTPFLDSLAPQSIVMRNAIVAGAPTYYSFPAIMASRFPLALGRDVLGLAPDETTIATTLKESGYATAAFLAGNPYLSSQFGYDSGFNIFRDFLDGSDFAADTTQPGNSPVRSRLNQLLNSAAHKFALTGSVYDELYFQYCQRMTDTPKSFDELRRFPAADVIVDEACTWLANVSGQPFFLWLHFMDPHSPYYPKEEALGSLERYGRSASRAHYLNSYWNRSDIGPTRLKKHREQVISLYDAGIRWVDSQIGRLVDTLRTQGNWENCIFALTADHGEEFLDHGGRYHAPSKITEELIRVPLLLHVLGTMHGQTTEAPYSLLHLAPTLLDAMDVPVPGSFGGHSFWHELQEKRSWDEPAIIECVAGCTNPFRFENRLGPRILGIREQRYKLVLDFAGSAEEMFDLQNDPEEVNPLAAHEQEPVRRRLLQRAYRHLVESTQSRDPQHRLDAQLQGIQLELAHS
jgi:arylsulfatase A-like enzyme